MIVIKTVYVLLCLYADDLAFVIRIFKTVESKDDIELTVFVFLYLELL